MINIGRGFYSSIKKITSGLLVLMTAFSCYGGISGVKAEEVPEKAFWGVNNADVVLENLDYSDVRSSGTWASEAIYETGALDIMKGYGDKRFGRLDTISKEQAIAIAYRLVGREADAQRAAEALNAARAQDVKKTGALSIWSDGYLQLAANEGLISAQDLQDALNEDQTSIDPVTGFFRGAPAQRQEMATWIAKALNLNPVYGQQEIFNSYIDWRSSDADKIPYIEAVLENNIMNGNGDGRFNPRQPVNREQAAQIVKNAEKTALSVLGYQKYTGTIENMTTSRELSNGQRIETAVFNVRNINGKLHTISVGYLNDPSQTDRNEQNGKYINPEVLDLVVYKNGMLANSTILNNGDRIEYIAAPDNMVKFVKVFSSVLDTSYIVAQVKSVDMQNQRIDISQFFTLETPDISAAQAFISFDAGGEKPVDSYIYSSNVSVRLDNGDSGIEHLEPGDLVLLTAVNDIVTDIESFSLNKVREQEQGIVNGIVEENNPELGYITLFREDGTGTSLGMDEVDFLRTFNYSGRDDVEAYRNHVPVDKSEIAPGDSVFLKLNEDMEVVSVSSASNYIVKYGKILSSTPTTIAVQYEDGSQQVLDMDDETIVVSKRKIVDYDSIKDGDSVKLILHQTNNFTKVKELVIQETAGDIVSNLYKGTFSYLDPASNKLVIQNLEVLDKDRWLRTDHKGFVDIPLGDGYGMYSGDQTLDANRVNRYMKNNTAYIAVVKGYGGEERAVMISFVDSDDPEDRIYDDTISNPQQSISQFTLDNENKLIKYTKGTIVVKDGRLTTGSSILRNDSAYVVATMDVDNSGRYAGIVNITERLKSNTLQYYRGRINAINDNQDFTVESFSEFNDITWNYSNTPKSFKITYNTRILNSDGVVSQRDFVGYGTNSYLKKVVYVVAKDGEAILVSDAPFSNPYIVKGQISGAVGTGGTMSLRSVVIYDSTNFIWKDSSEMTLTILNNSVIIKDGKVIKASELKKGDNVKVIKGENTAAGDAYMVFVET